MTMLCFLLAGFRSAAQAAPDVQRKILPNGLTLLVSEDHALPFVTFQFLIDSGSRRDPCGEEGLAYLSAKGLLLGTDSHTAEAINRELDFMGAAVDVSTERDFVTLSLRVLKKHSDRGFGILAEILTRPVFPEAEIRREKERTLGLIQAKEEQPGEFADEAFQRALFLNSPYAHPIEGTKESLMRIDRDSLSRFHRSYYHPNKAILTIVGDTTWAELEKSIIPFLSGWSLQAVPQDEPAIAFAEGPKSVQIERRISQANIVLGNPGLSRENPDYYAAVVMNYILGGGGFSSRLMEEIRTRRGLAYSVDSGFEPYKYAGAFEIALQTKNASAREAICLALQEMKRMREKRVSSKELSEAKSYLIGSFPLRINTQAKLARFLGQVEYFNLGLDYMEKYPSLVRAVTSDQILQVAKRYLHPESRILVVVGDLKEAGLEGSGPQN